MNCWNNLQASQEENPNVNASQVDSNQSTQVSQTLTKRKAIKGRSEVWDHFTKFKDKNGDPKAKCKYCEKCILHIVKK